MSKLKILPSGLASDDEENCLVADSKNNRLVVFNRELQMTKVRGTITGIILIINSPVLQIMTAEREHQRPQDILRVGRQVYVVYSGGEEAAQPAVVRYRLQPGGERD